MGPLPSDVHVNTPLTDMSVAWIQRQSNFIHDRVFPSIPVGKQSDLYYRLPRGAFNRSQIAPRAPGAPAQAMAYAMDTDSYRCEVFALSHQITDEARGNADVAVNLDRQGTELLTLQGRLHREITWASTFFKSSVWTRDVTGVAVVNSPANQVLQWNDANSNPIDNVRAEATRQQLLTGFRPNVLTLGQPALDALVEHPEIIDRVKYGQTQGGPARANLNILAQLFEMDEVLVASAIQNTSAEGVADSNAWIVGKGAMLSFRPQAPGLMTPSAGYTFNWKSMGGTGQGVRIMSARHPDPTTKSDLIWIEDSFVHKVVSADMGTYFDSIVA